MVVGGYGVFGRLVAVELFQMGLPLVLAGRDAAAAERAAATLGPGCRGVAADVTDPDACRALVAGAGVVVSCAGPFSALGVPLLEACLAGGCHYVDIADDRAYVRAVRARSERFAERGLCAVYGCSSLPAISIPLAMRARRAQPDPPVRARISLFIGNDNPKGFAAVRSAVGLLGRPISTPQGTVLGFRDRTRVALPPPFGRRAVYNFESPDLDLIPELLGVSEVVVKAGFELALGGAAFAALAWLGASWGDRTARLLAAVGGLTRGLGCSGGAVMAELAWDEERTASAALSTATEGQRMAALPCAYVASALAQRPPRHPGAVAAYELLDPDALLAQLVADGCTMTVS